MLVQNFFTLNFLYFYMVHGTGIRGTHSKCVDELGEDGEDREDSSTSLFSTMLFFVPDEVCLRISSILPSTSRRSICFVAQCSFALFSGLLFIHTPLFS